MNSPSKQHILDGFRSVWGGIGQLLAQLDDDEWRRPTPLPAWDVQANVAHIFGTEAFLLGRQPPAPGAELAPTDHVHNPIGELNETWVTAYRHATPDEMRAAFSELTTERLRILAAMSDEEWDAVGFTPAGEAPYGRFMQIRVFDCWMHEQDIRVALDRPGHIDGPAVDITLDEMSNAMGFVVGKRGGATAGSSVTFDLTGPQARRFHVDVGERARVVDALSGPATTTLTMPVLSFTRIAGGRGDAPDHVDRCVITGDETLGRRILDNLSYTI